MGNVDLPQDYTKALELWHQAGELGYTEAITNVGYFYDIGIGVERDEEKAMYHYELAAMKGDMLARHNLGLEEEKAGNMDRALRHFMIAAGSGSSISLKVLKVLYSNGRVTKEDYTTVLRSYQAYLSEIKSPQRDKAAAADDQYRYYD